MKVMEEEPHSRIRRRTGFTSAAVVRAILLKWLPGRSSWASVQRAKVFDVVASPVAKPNRLDASCDCCSLDAAEDVLADIGGQPEDPSVEIWQ
jgi:hypothetical protein